MIHPKEGIMQGNCLAMSMYRVALISLASKTWEAVPEALQPWYYNKIGVAGKALPNSCCLNFLIKFGPQYGYFPEPGKLCYTCKAKDEDVARQTELQS